MELLVTLKWKVEPNLALCLCASECPLTLAVQLEESCELIKVLRNGGAHLDFRTRDGITALHRAVLCRNSAALTVRKLWPSPGGHFSLNPTTFVHFSEENYISDEFFPVWV